MKNLFMIGLILLTVACGKNPNSDNVQGRYIDLMDVYQELRFVDGVPQVNRMGMMEAVTELEVMETVNTDYEFVEVVIVNTKPHASYFACYVNGRFAGVQKGSDCNVSTSRSYNRVVPADKGTMVYIRAVFGQTYSSDISMWINIR